MLNKLLIFLPTLVSYIGIIVVLWWQHRNIWRNNMLEITRNVKMRGFIIDSLVARSGRSLSPDVIGEITQEILERMIDINDNMDMVKAPETQQ